MSSYRHTARVSRPGSGSRGVGEAWVAGADTALYDGAADVQDGGFTARHAEQGATRLGNRASVFLPPAGVAAVLGLAKAGDGGDLVTITYGDARGTRTGRLVQVDEDDGALEVEWLR